MRKQVCKERAAELKTLLFLFLRTFEYNAKTRILTSCDVLPLAHTLLSKLEQVFMLQLTPKILAEFIHRSLIKWQFNKK